MKSKLLPTLYGSSSINFKINFVFDNFKKGSFSKGLPLLRMSISDDYK